MLQGLNFDPSSDKEAARIAFNALVWVAKRPLALSNARIGPPGGCLKAGLEVGHAQSWLVSQGTTEAFEFCSVAHVLLSNPTWCTY